MSTSDLYMWRAKPAYVAWKGCDGIRHVFGLWATGGFCLRLRHGVRLSAVFVMDTGEERCRRRFLEGSRVDRMSRFWAVGHGRCDKCIPRIWRETLGHGDVFYSGGDVCLAKARRVHLVHGPGYADALTALWHQMRRPRRNAKETLVCSSLVDHMFPCIALDEVEKPVRSVKPAPARHRDTKPPCSTQ